MSNHNTPTTGFHTNPENINRNGRPPKDHTLTELLKKALSQPRTEDGKTKKQELIDIMLDLALVDKDKDIMKYIYNRLEGMPKQSMDIEVEDITPTKFIIEGEEDATN